LVGDLIAEACWHIVAASRNGRAVKSLGIERGPMMSNGATAANQRKILANQRRILANQRRIEANQAKLDEVLVNQKKLERILANQKTILSKLR
jgi:hypothetical protein